MKDKAVMALIAWALTIVLVFNILQARSSDSLGPDGVEAGTETSSASAAVTREENAPNASRNNDDLLPGEVQELTINTVIVEGAQSSDSLVSDDGTSFTVNAHLTQGNSYKIYVALNNASDEPQAAELTATASGLTFEVSLPEKPADAFNIEKKDGNHWILHSSPTGQGGSGLFDLLITVRTDGVTDSVADFSLSMTDADGGAFALSSR